MEIAKSSLYNDGVLNSFSDGSKQLTRRRKKYIPQVQDFWHILTEGESLYELANSYYGSETIWWLIADANLIVNPFALTGLVGRYLLIPNFDIYSFNAANEQNRHAAVVGELGESIDDSDVTLPSFLTQLPLPSIIPNPTGGGGNVTVVSPTKKNARAFFLLPDGGYRMLTTDSDNALDLIDGHLPTDFDNSIIFERPL